MPNQPIAQCGYAQGKMSINGASMILGIESQVFMY